jgi:hypothetical protein
MITYRLATREHLEQLVNILQGGGLIKSNSYLQNHDKWKSMLNSQNHNNKLQWDSNIEIKAHRVIIDNPKVNLVLDSLHSNSACICTLDLDSVEERELLDRHCPKLLEPMGEGTSQAMNTVSNHLQPLRAMVDSIHGCHVGEQGL